MRLILASASPRRAELLHSAGFEFDIDPANIEEGPRDGELPATYTLRVAREKAEQVASRHPEGEVVVLGADTEVVIDRRILGKPSDHPDARRMLEILSGREHWVFTGLVLIGPTRRAEEVVSTRVSFSRLTGTEMDWYVSSGEPMGKAGAYAIQGLGARFIERIDGSWSNVVGLPLATIHRLLREVQWSVDPAGP
jgi:septum formation protein